MLNCGQQNCLKLFLTLCVVKTCVFSLCVYRYDPQTDVWTAVAPMSISRDAVGVCLLGDRLYAVGGYDGQVYLNTVEAYDPQTNEWTQVHTQTHTRNKSLQSIYIYRLDLFSYSTHMTHIYIHAH